MVTGRNWATVQQLFDELVDLGPEAREARLNAQDVDHATASNVRSLLAASETDGVLDRADALVPPPKPADSYSSLDSGAVVGPFTIERLIRRGGIPRL